VEETLVEWAAKEGLENHLIMALEWPLTLLQLIFVLLSKWVNYWVVMVREKGIRKENNIVLL